MLRCRHKCKNTCGMECECPQRCSQFKLPGDMAGSKTSFAGLIRQPGYCDSPDGSGLRIATKDFQFHAEAAPAGPHLRINGQAKRTLGGAAILAGHQVKKGGNQSQSGRTAHASNRSYQTIAMPRGDGCPDLDLAETYIHTPLDCSGRRVDKKKAELEQVAPVREPLGQSSGEWGGLGYADDVERLRMMRNQEMQAKTLTGTSMNTTSPKEKAVDFECPKSHGKKSHRPQQLVRPVRPSNTEESSPLEPHRKWDDEGDSVTFDVAARVDGLTVNDEPDRHGGDSSGADLAITFQNSKKDANEDSENLISF